MLYENDEKMTETGKGYSKMKIIRRIIKAYRIFLFILFLCTMIAGTAGLWVFYEFIQPVSYETYSLGEIMHPGRISVSVSTSRGNDVGIILISPSGKEYTRSSRDVSYAVTEDGFMVSVLTADTGVWNVRMKDVPGVSVSFSRHFDESDAAILVSTSATEDKKPGHYVVSMQMSAKNYSYTIKAVRRLDGFSLTSRGDGGSILNLEPYAYTSGVWDFYLNTERGSEEYGTVFSYTF